jgi:U3 small nucleolar RNA-associated protein 15
MTDGTLSVRRRQTKPLTGTASDLPFSASTLRSGTFESFLGGSVSAIGQGTVRSKTKTKPLGDENEWRVESKRSKRLKEYDRLMKGFKYSAALDSVLRKVSATTCYYVSPDSARSSKFRQQQHSRSFRN